MGVFKAKARFKEKSQRRAGTAANTTTSSHTLQPGPEQVLTGARSERSRGRPQGRPPARR